MPTILYLFLNKCLNCFYTGRHTIWLFVSEDWRTLKACNSLYRLVKRHILWLVSKSQIEGFLVLCWACISCRIVVYECHRWENQTAKIAPSRNPPWLPPHSPQPSQSSLRSMDMKENRQTERFLGLSCLTHKLWNNSNRQDLLWEQGWCINMCLWEKVQVSSARIHACTHTHTQWAQVGTWTLPVLQAMRRRKERENIEGRVRQNDNQQKRGRARQHRFSVIKSGGREQRGHNIMMTWWRGGKDRGKVYI